MSTKSSIKNNKRIILKNPDGTYSYLYKDGEEDSIMNKAHLNKGKDKDLDPLNQNQENINNLSMSDEELQFLIDNANQFDYQHLINQILEIFRSYRVLFFLVLILELCLMSTLLFNTYKTKEASILIMEEIYKDLNAEEASLFFNIVFVIFTSLNAFYYPVGFYAITQKQIKILKFFSIFSLYSAIATIFVIYINVFFVFVFVLRLILYGFSKFVINLLVSIILIPNRHQQAHNYVDNNDSENSVILHFNNLNNNFNANMNNNNYNNDNRQIYIEDNNYNANTNSNNDDNTSVDSDFEDDNLIFREEINKSRKSNVCSEKGTL